MVYHGKVKNGVIILDESVRLPEGVSVRIDVQENGEAIQQGEVTPSSFDRFKEFIGSAHGLPADAARNVDHYLYGRPRT